jgi:hypothetical protein
MDATSSEMSALALLFMRRQEYTGAKRSATTGESLGSCQSIDGWNSLTGSMDDEEGPREPEYEKERMRNSGSQPGAIA